MALTSKTDVKSDCLPLNSSKLKYHIPHKCIDRYLIKRILLVINIFQKSTNVSHRVRLRPVLTENGQKVKQSRAERRREVKG